MRRSLKPILSVLICVTFGIGALKADDLSNPNRSKEWIEGCRIHLRLIHDALTEYSVREKDLHKDEQTALPYDLLSLVPDYLGDLRYLTCPAAAALGLSTSGNVRVRDISETSSSYAYQFSTNQVPYATLGGGAIFASPRSYKLAQMAYVGDMIPTVRCDFHGPNRFQNLALNGRIYESGDYWERQFVDTLPMPYLANIEIIIPERTKNYRTPSRIESLPYSETMVDLTPCYNARLSHSWAGTLRALDLSSLIGVVSSPTGIAFDVRGAVQLQGSVFRTTTFPMEAKRIRVDRHVRQVFLLCGELTDYQTDKTAVQYGFQFQGFPDAIRWSPDSKSIADARGAGLACQKSEQVHIRSFPWEKWESGGLRLFTLQWNCPPEYRSTPLESVEFRSLNAHPAPLLLGLTVGVSE